MKEIGKTVNFLDWLTKVNVSRQEYWETHYGGDDRRMDFIVTKGRKFIKLRSDRSIWGFVSMYDGLYKGEPIKKGDLLRPAGMKSPAKHARGNIFDGTANFTFFGPEYLK
jgi:hypothetical protein